MTTEHRAYSTFEIKSADDDERVIEGIASTPTPDRGQDIVDPKGAQFLKNLPFLWQHDHHKPIGRVESVKATKDGITFKARLAKIDEPGELKNLLDLSWQSIKSGLVRGISIGFKPIEFSFIETTGGLHFKEIELLEISAVTIPMNAEATIQTVKAMDTEQRQAVSAQPSDAEAETDDPSQSGGTKSRKAHTLITPRGKKMNLQEQLDALKESVETKEARMAEIIAKAGEENRVTDQSEADEYDDLEVEVDNAKADMARVEKMVARQASAATPVEKSAGTNQKAASEQRGGALVLKDNIEPGIMFTRMAIAIAQGKGSRTDAHDFAVSRWKDAHQLHTVLKAAVAAGTTTDPAWAGSLSDYTTMANDFLDFLRPQTILGKMTGFHSVPFMTRVGRGTAGGSADWVDEGNPKPLTAGAFDTIELGMSKIAAISVITQELARSSAPSAEMKVRRDLSGAVIQRMDRDFLDPAKAAGTSSPASVTNGVTAVVASGTTSAALEADVMSMWQPMINANLDISSGYFIMTPGMALRIGMMRNALGQKVYETLGAAGGSLMGYPVITSNNLAAGSLSGSTISFILPSEILLADDNGVTLDASDQATLEMDDAPTPGSVATVSLWQRNMLGIRAERFVKWVKGRPEAAGYIDNAAYTN